MGADLNIKGKLERNQLLPSVTVKIQVRTVKKFANQTILVTVLCIQRIQPAERLHHS